MKKPLLLAVVWFCVANGVATGQQQKTRFGDIQKPGNPADYPLSVQVNRSSLTGVSANVHLYLDVVLDGKKLQLESQTGETAAALLHLGTYKARLIKDDEMKSGFFSIIYDLLFPDGSHLLFDVVSESE
jgi:hypothetical protein